MSPSSLNYKIGSEAKEIEINEKNPIEAQMKEKERLQREVEQTCKPFFLGNLIIHKPWIIILGMLVLEALCIGLMSSGNYMEATEDKHGRMFLIWGSEKTDKFDSRIAAIEELDDHNQAQVTRLNSQNIQKWTLNLIYQDQRGDDLMMPSHLSTIRDLELEYEREEAKDHLQFCFKKEEGSECSKLSMLSSLDAQSESGVKE